MGGYSREERMFLFLSRTFIEIQIRFQIRMNLIRNGLAQKEQRCWIPQLSYRFRWEFEIALVIIYVESV
jgi:hypothetical protein